MTFACRTFQGMQPSGGAQSFSASLANTSASTGIRNASFNLVNDGTATTGASPAGGHQSCGPWFTPTTASIGNSFWAKMVLGTNSGTTVSGSAVGSVVSLSGATNWTFTNTGTSTEGTGSASVFIYSDAGGTQLVATGSVSWDVGFAP
jgi:hypothetical protein